MQEAIESTLVGLLVFDAGEQKFDKTSAADDQLELWPRSAKYVCCSAGGTGRRWNARVTVPIG
ncbi:MAG: hypothetical protein HOV71_02300 [Hamadaea sp.]|nr:hypothetical protein [Hamadaea sp.]NUT05613.1 hypothetical protein [Hamadaea sp.]